MASFKESASQSTTAKKNKPQTELSRAASIMRSSTATPEERKAAAKLLGRKGGIHSHDNDPGRSRQAHNSSALQNA